MNILVCYNGNLFPVSADGQSLRIYNIFKRLSCKHNIYLLCVKDQKFAWGEDEQEKAERLFRKTWFYKFDRKLSGLVLDYISVDHSCRLTYRLEIKQINKLIEEIISNNDINLIYANGFPLIRILSYHTHIPKLLDICDSRALLKKREYKKASNYINKLISYMQYVRANRIERFILSRFHTTTVVSDADANYIYKKIKKSMIKIIPNGVDSNYFKPLNNLQKKFPSLIFFGSMDFAPNIDAALFLQSKILPLVKEKIKNVNLYIVGRNPVGKLLSINGKNNTIVTGAVNDIRPYIMRSTVVVIPMRIGSGIKNKVLEAMAMGKPVVATPLAVEALKPELTINILIGRDAFELSKKTCLLIQNQKIRKDLGEKGIIAVRKHYSWRSCAQQYEKIFCRMISQAGPKKL